jgi:hypothetical protein
MPCPKCGRMMCDCSPAERGQSPEEMMDGYDQDVQNLKKKNPITDFVVQGGNLTSQEGAELIKKASREQLKEAAKDPAIMRQLVAAMNGSTDPYLRRQILLAISD